MSHIRLPIAEKFNLSLKAELWSDRLSPILIKEFRQGLRSQLFTWAFMLIHVFMVAGLLFNLGMGSSSGRRAEAEVLFWVMVSAPLLLFLPFGAMSSISLERRDGTLDLLQLAHQKTFRLILGKWLGHAALTLLLVLAISPYMVLRYYIGGMDVFSDLQTLLLILLASGLLTAIAILCSSYNVHPMRQWLTFLVLSFVFLMCTQGLVLGLNAMSGRGLGLGHEEFSGLLGYIPFVGLSLLFLLLKWATIQVAPETEDHGYALRWFYIAFMLGNILFCCLNSSRTVQGMMFFTALIMTLVVNLRGLTEPPAHYAGQVTRFCKCGWIHDLHAFFMAPGWATAFFFVLLSLGLLILNMFSVDSIYRDICMGPQPVTLVVGTLFMAIVCPCIIGHFLPFGPQSPLIRSLIAAALLLMPFFLYALGKSLDEPWQALFIIPGQVLPVSSAFMVIKLSHSNPLLHPLAILISHVIVWLGLSWVCYVDIRKTFAAIQHTMVQRG